MPQPGSLALPLHGTAEERRHLHQECTTAGAGALLSNSSLAKVQGMKDTQQIAVKGSLQLVENENSNCNPLPPTVKLEVDYNNYFHCSTRNLIAHPMNSGRR